MKKINAGILGATGMVGQRFITLLGRHPWFNVVALAASPKSAGLSYKKAVADKWKMEEPIPSDLEEVKVLAVKDDLETVASQVDLVFSCLDMEKEDIQNIEIAYAAAGIPVASNNSAHRWTKDVPMIMPEINPEHLKLIAIQQKNRGWDKGFIAVKPNCSIQSYVSILTALQSFQPLEVSVTSLQAISGAGKNFESWPEMVDNVIPLIGGEEEKSEKEPMKIWGSLKNGTIIPAENPKIAATCIRVPVTNGHMASVKVRFAKKPTKKQMLDAIASYKNPIAELRLPSAPQQFIKYFAEENRPQTKLDRDFEKGMGITMGRLEEDSQYDWKFIALSHNTIRGAAGGAILMAELLAAKKYL
jgi:aspartate-semialdehyde dehydrogenase